LSRRKTIITQLAFLKWRW